MFLSTCPLIFDKVASSIAISSASNASNLSLVSVWLVDVIIMCYFLIEQYKYCQSASYEKQMSSQQELSGMIGNKWE